MDSGRIATTVFCSFDGVDHHYYSYVVETSWQKTPGSRHYSWETTVMKIDRDGGQSRLEESSAFDFSQYAPLTGEIYGNSGHRAAREAHDKVLLLIMG